MWMSPSFLFVYPPFRTEAEKSDKPLFKMKYLLKQIPNNLFRKVCRNFVFLFLYTNFDHLTLLKAQRGGEGSDDNLIKRHNCTLWF